MFRTQEMTREEISRCKFSGAVGHRFLGFDENGKWMSDKMSMMAAIETDETIVFVCCKNRGKLIWKRILEK